MRGVSGHLQQCGARVMSTCPIATHKKNVISLATMFRQAVPHVLRSSEAVISRGYPAATASLAPLAAGSASGTLPNNAAAASRRSGSSLSRQERRRPVLYLDPCTINWDRWELLMLRRAQEAGLNDDDDEGEEEEGEEQMSFPALLAAADMNAAYFRRWDDPSLHQPLLQDRALTAAWREALAAAPPGALEGRTVLDVGCGLGLLSMLAAKAGAARVVAVDGSEGAVEAARRIIKANDLADKITVVHGALEDLDELPGMSPAEIDVVMSNWMGPGLLTGGMIHSVAHAVKRWLRPGGVVLPDRVSLWAAGLEDREALQEAKEAWSRMAGLDMSAAMAQVIQHPRLDVLTRKSQLLSTPQRLATWQLEELKSGEVLQRAAGGAGEEEEEEEAVYARCPFTFTSLRDERLFGLVLYWEALWTWGVALEGEGRSPVRFTTHPMSAANHYKQLMLDLPRTVRLAADDEVSGELVLRPGTTDPRDLEMRLRVSHGASPPITASYRVSHLQGP